MLLLKTPGVVVSRVATFERSSYLSGSAPRNLFPRCEMRPLFSLSGGQRQSERPRRGCDTVFLFAARRGFVLRRGLSLESNERVAGNICSEPLTARTQSLHTVQIYF